MGETSMDNEYRIHKYFLCYKQSCIKSDHVNENHNTMGRWGIRRTQKTEALLTTVEPRVLTINNSFKHETPANILYLGKRIIKNKACIYMRKMG